MTQTLIGFQNLSDSKIIALELCSDSGELSTTGKILNNLYTSTALAKKLIEEGTPNENKIDVSSVVNIDNYMWGLVGTNFGTGYRILDTVNEFQQIHSSVYKYLYMFSETDGEWHVSSNDNQIFRSLANEL
tara:strand:+ start:73 stop:465 length:393 start_codon:yes stop_codon:yes gene_type:complete